MLGEVGTLMNRQKTRKQVCGWLNTINEQGWHDLSCMPTNLHVH